MECNFCKNVLKTISSLNYHLKNNKKCLEIQKQTIGIVNSALSVCEHCNNSFSVANINSHISNCKVKKKKDHEKLKTDIITLKNQNNILKTSGQIENSVIKDTTFILTLQNGEKINIGIRSDGYINATQLCKAGCKEFEQYKEDQQTQEYLKYLSSIIGISTFDLILTNKGENCSETYVHRKIGYHLAQWISSHFAIQVSNILDNIFITGKYDCDNKKSNIELENIYQEKINVLNKELDIKNNKLKVYEVSIFNTQTDIFPIKYFRKNVLYFIKFTVPKDIKTKYISKYEKLNNKDYSSIEFGVSSDFEERFKSHRNDKKKTEIIFIHAIELKERYIAAKAEQYVKRIVKQMNIKFDYEKKKECFIANEEEFNIMLNKIKEGLLDMEEYSYNNEIENDNEDCEDEYNCNNDDKIDIIKYKYSIDKEIKLKKMETEKEIEKEKIHKEIELKKIEMITDLFKNKLITIEEYKYILNI
jgi:hypothetical protein